MTRIKLSTAGKNYRRLLCTYFIVMIFPLIVGIIMTFVLNRETEKAINVNYEDRLNYSADTLDQILRNAGTCAFKISADQNVISYSKIKIPLMDSEMEYLKKPIQTSIIAETNVNESNVADIIVYFPQSGVMLSTQRTYRNEDREILCGNTLGMTFAEFVRLSETVKGRQYCISSGKNKAGDSVPFLIQKGLGANSSLLSVIIVLKQDSLAEALAYSNGTAIIGTGSTDYFTAGEDLYTDDFLNILFSDEATESNHVISGFDSVVFAKKSQVCNWHYVLVLDKNDYQNHTSSFRTILILIFLATALVGIFMIIQISRLVYSPLKKLIGDTGEAFTPVKGADEFAYLREVFRKLRDNQTELIQANLPGTNSLVSLTLNSILCQDSWPNDHLAEKLHLQSPHYLISILDIELLSEKLLSTERSEDEYLFFQNLKKSFHDSSSEKSLFYYNRMSEDNKKQVNFSAYNILNELLDTENILKTFVEGNIVLILLLSEDAEKRQLEMEEFDRKMNHCCDILRSQAGIMVSVVIEDPTETREQLHDRYNRLKLYLKKKHFLGSGENRVIYPGKEQQNELEYDKSYEIEKSIGNKIVEKEYDVAYQMLEYFFDYVLKHSADQALPVLELRMYGMIYVLITSLGLNTGEQLMGSDLSDRGSLLSPEFLLASENILELRNNVQVLFRKLIEMHQDDSQKTVLARSEEIRDYVKKHAFSPDICAATICNEFHISASYLSRIFKQTTGNNLLKYIHGVRIERAKELLAGTDIGINDISDLVGFSDRRTFDRVFTASEKMTPYNYRTDHQKEVEE